MLTQLSQAQLCKSFIPTFFCKEPWAKICCSGVLLRMPWTTAPSPSSASWFCRRSVGKQLQYCIYSFFKYSVGKWRSTFSSLSVSQNNKNNAQFTITELSYSRSRINWSPENIFISSWEPDLVKIQFSGDVNCFLFNAIKVRQRAGGVNCNAFWNRVEGRFDMNW